MVQVFRNPADVRMHSNIDMQRRCRMCMIADTIEDGNGELHWALLRPSQAAMDFLTLQ